MSARREAMLAQVVDRNMYEHEATYHQQVDLFRRWLEMTERAMQDEGLSSQTAERVLNRMIYGVPDSPEAYDRYQQYLEQQRLFAMFPPRDAAWLTDLQNTLHMRGNV